MKSVDNVKVCFSDEIIPLFEIINDTYEKRYQIDPETGKIRTEKEICRTGLVRNKKVEKEPTEEDIITLMDLSSKINGKKMFADFFRYHIDEYHSKNVKTSALNLSRRLLDDEYYVKRIKGCLEFENIIPVISLKPKLCLSKEKIEELIEVAHNNGKMIAIRIETGLLDTYKDMLEGLWKEDYLLVDIRHNYIDSKIMELEDLQGYDIDAKKILLNSPKDEVLYNTQYEEDGLTELIDNSARERYQEFGLDGYGDYAGVADKLPLRSGGITGSATILMYRYDVNQFEVFRNPDSSLGMNGYIKVYEDVMRAENRLNIDKDCIAYEVLHKSQKSIRSWGFWAGICITRYIHQIYKYIQK